MDTSDQKDRRQCTATSKQSKQRCKRRPIPGGTVCVMHGGKAPQVRAKAKERLLDVIDPDRVFREMARIGFSDTSQVFDENGNVLPVSKWPANLRRAVGGIEVVKRNIYGNDGVMDEVLKVKFWDKPKALEQMAKILQMYEERFKGDVNVTFGWADK